TPLRWLNIAPLLNAARRSPWRQKTTRQTTPPRTPFLAKTRGHDRRGQTLLPLGCYKTNFHSDDKPPTLLLRFGNLIPNTLATPHGEVVRVGQYLLQAPPPWVLEPRLLPAFLATD